MKVNVNESACVGCGMCASTCEEVFEISDAGVATVKKDVNVDQFKEKVLEASEGCPTGAIEVSE